MAKGKGDIIPGVGLRDHSLGASEDKTREVLGAPEVLKPGCWLYHSKGVEATFVRGELVTLHFHFRTKDFAFYPGTTPEGIDGRACPIEVIQLLGEPTKRYESTSSIRGIPEM